MPRFVCALVCAVLAGWVTGSAALARACPSACLGPFGTSAEVRAAVREETRTMLVARGDATAAGRGWALRVRPLEPTAVHGDERLSVLSVRAVGPRRRIVDTVYVVRQRADGRFACPAASLRLRSRRLDVSVELSAVRDGQGAPRVWTSRITGSATARLRDGLLETDWQTQLAYGLLGPGSPTTAGIVTVEDSTSITDGVGTDRVLAVADAEVGVDGTLRVLRTIGDDDGTLLVPVGVYPYGQAPCPSAGTAAAGTAGAPPPDRTPPTAR